VGTQKAGLVGTGGTLNLNTGSALAFPAAPGITSTFRVEGGTLPGQVALVNMYVAAIPMAVARVAAMDLEGGGVLNSNNGAIGMMPIADAIGGNLNNAGTIEFGSALHALGVGGAYTQTASGALDVRLGSGGPPPPISPSDAVAVAGVASLDGTLNLTAFGTLTAGQVWNPVGYGGGNPGPSDFDTVNFPSDGGTWTEAPGPAVVVVTKVT
jgi:hypothetical protein